MNGIPFDKPKQTNEIAKQFLIERNAETVKQWARERAGDDAEEEKKLLCLVRYYVRIWG